MQLYRYMVRQSAIFAGMLITTVKANAPRHASMMKLVVILDDMFAGVVIAAAVRSNGACVPIYCCSRDSAGHPGR